MKRKKKPNYKLRRTIAKIIIVILILIPIIYINRVKIIHAPLYIKYHKYNDVLNSLYDCKYNNKEVDKLLTKLVNKKRITEYTDDYILSLKDKGYNKNTISYALLNFKKGDIKSLINSKYDKDIEKMITISYFDYELYDRYLNARKEDESIERTVLKVDLDLDKGSYEDTIEETDPNSLTALVSKHRYVNEDYEPSDLVDMSDDYANNYYRQMQLRSEAYEWFKKMVDDAKKEDIKFYAESGYRTFKFQRTLYNNYVNNNGYAKANLYAARPGFSEHQLGTAIDLANIYTLEEDDEEYKWIMKNGYKYGYIFRYMEDTVDLTGFAKEPWHIRYVGVDVATKMHEENISFEEYWIKYVNKKEAK